VSDVAAAPSPAEGREPNPEAVEVLLDAAEKLISDERERGRALDTKTAQLATFSGTILTLDVALGAFAFRSHLGSLAEVLLPIFFLITAAGLLASAGFAVAGVLRPQKFLSIDREAVKGFAHHPLISSDQTFIRGRLLTSVTEDQLPRERQRNDGKVRWTKWAAIALLVGLVGIAGQAATIGLDRLGI
jgi:hypothetical protein